MANIWCELWEVFVVSFKAKTLKRFSFTQKMLDLVLILFMFLVCSPCNEQLKIQIYDHSLVPIPMWCEERWVSKPTSSPFSLPTITSVAPPTTTPLSSPWNQPYGAPSFSYFSPLQYLSLLPAIPELPASAFSSHHNPSSISGWLLCQLCWWVNWSVAFRP
jgi:hypothetical protein